jgi:HSP20 family protein
MGIIDKVTSLLPWRGGRQEPPHRADALALRDDLDRWFERVMGEPWSAAALGALRHTPSVDVRETDKELIVTAEVPGLDRDDIKLTITPEGLTIRGEKREESEDRRKDGVVAQSRYERFVRSVPLPPGLDVDRAEARVKNGVLTVRFPKVDARPGARRIPIET